MKNEACGKSQDKKISLGRLARLKQFIMRMTGMESKWVWIGVPIVFVLALLVYGITILYIGVSPSNSDAFNYHVVAQRLAITNTYTWAGISNGITETMEPNSFVLPGYVIFLSIFYRLVPLTGDFSANYTLVQNSIVFIQYLMTGFATVAIFVSGYFLGGKRVSVLSTLIALGYLGIGANAATMFTETITYFYASFILLSMIALLTKRGSPYFWSIIFGLFSGLYLITRAAIAIFIALFLVLWVAIHYRSPKKAIVHALVAILCIGVFMGPWIVRNYVIYDRVIIFNTGSGRPILHATNWAGWGEYNPTEEELEKFGYNDATGLPNWGAIANYRIANARREMGWRNFIEFRYISNARAYPRWPTLLQLSPEAIQESYPYVVGNLEYERPFREEIGRNFFWYMVNYHMYMVFLAVLGTPVALLRTREREGSRIAFALLAVFFLYMFFVHTSILFMSRYMYQTLPATFLLAGGVVLLLPQKPLRLPLIKNKTDKGIVAEGVNS